MCAKFLKLHDLWTSPTRRLESYLRKRITQIWSMVGLKPHFCSVEARE